MYNYNFVIHQKIFSMYQIFLLAIANVELASFIIILFINFSYCQFFNVFPCQKFLLYDIGLRRFKIYCDVIMYLYIATYIIKYGST